MTDNGHGPGTTYPGISFLKKEAKVYQDLKLLREAGEIEGFEMQVPYELLPAQKVNGKVVERAVKYVADFVIHGPEGLTAVLDVKGMRTPVYKLKRKLMLFRHGIKISEV